MIKSLIFDFGDVFINLDKQGALRNAMELFQLENFSTELLYTNTLYETGSISTKDFIEFYRNRFPNCSEKDIVNAWNFILKDFPLYRLDFVKELKDLTNYKLLLLSNTNEMHIDHIKKKFGFYEEFRSCFDQFYLSHEIQMRKPDRNIFEFVLNENALKPDECLFIDDTRENTDIANSLGIHTWNIDETKEDVVNLFSIKSSLF